MAYDAGAARASYIIDLAQARAAAEELKRIYADLKTSAAQSNAGGVNIPQASRTTAAISAQERALNQLRNSEIAAARATGDHARALQVVEAELQRAGQGTTRYNQLLVQQARIQKDIDRAAQPQGGRGPVLPRSAEFFGPQAIGQLLGVTLGPQLLTQAIGAGVEAGRQALALRETQNSLRAVAGDMRTYNETLAAARQQQILFGGTLQENIEGLSGLTITARSSGASLKTLIDLSQRLAVLDPAQGAQGARIALNEALSGDPTSLAKRYEIPRAALAKLRDTSISTEERLDVINQFLNRVGITSASVADKVDQSALAFRRLGAELETTRLSAGDQLATAFTGAATGLARLVGLINNNPQAIAELRALFQGKATVGQTDIDRAAEEIARRKATETLFGGLGGRTQARADLIQQLGGQDGVRRAEEALTRLQLAGDAAAQAGANLTEQFKAKLIPLESYIAGIQELAARESGAIEPEERRVIALNALRDAQDTVINSMRQASTEMDQAAQASIKDAAAKDAQQAKTALLQEQTKQAVNAFLALNPNIDAAGIAALVAAGKIPPLIGQLGALRLASDSARDGLALLAAQQNVLASVQKGLSGAQVTTDKVASAIAGLGTGAGKDTTVLDTANRIRASENALALARAKNANERIAVLQRELGQTNDIAEKNRLLAQIEQERQSLARDATRSTKAHTTELDKQLSLEERIRDAKQSQLRASLEVQKLAGQDVLDRLKEQQELAKADRILRSGRASAEFKAAAAARESIISADQQLRQLDIAEKTLTAGGQIINGRVFQTRQTGATPTAGATTAGAPPVGAAAPAPAAQGITLRLVDAAGRVIADAVAPFILQDMGVGLAQSNSAGAGR